MSCAFGRRKIFDSDSCSKRFSWNKCLKCHLHLYLRNRLYKYWSMFQKIFSEWISKSALFRTYRRKIIYLWHMVQKIFWYILKEERLPCSKVIFNIDISKGVCGLGKLWKTGDLWLTKSKLIGFYSRMNFRRILSFHE